jgi:hypothetical protein
MPAGHRVALYHLQAAAAIPHGALSKVSAIVFSKAQVSAIVAAVHAKLTRTGTRSVKQAS